MRPAARGTKFRAPDVLGGREFVDKKIIDAGGCEADGQAEHCEGDPVGHGDRQTAGNEAIGEAKEHAKDKGYHLNQGPFKSSFLVNSTRPKTISTTGMPPINRFDSMIFLLFMREG